MYTAKKVTSSSCLPLEDIYIVCVFYMEIFLKYSLHFKRKRFLVCNKFFMKTSNASRLLLWFWYHKLFYIVHEKKTTFVHKLLNVVYAKVRTTKFVRKFADALKYLSERESVLNSLVTFQNFKNIELLIVTLNV